MVQSNLEQIPDRMQDQAAHARSGTAHLKSQLTVKHGHQTQSLFAYDQTQLVSCCWQQGTADRLYFCST